jgi:hypothetical protein
MLNRFAINLFFRKAGSSSIPNLDSSDGIYNQDVEVAHRPQASLPGRIWLCSGGLKRI